MRVLKGERGKPTYWCMLFQTNSLFSFLVFFSFLSVFVLILFFFLLLCFPFYVVKDPLSFDPFYRARQGPLYSACRDQCLLFCPLTAFVWSGCTCQSYKTPARQRRIHFVFLCAADSFCPSARRGLSCHDVNFLSPHTDRKSVV